MRRWTDAFPERLQAEVEAFKSTEGLDFTLDDRELATHGQVVFRGTLERPGRPAIELEIRYPDSFPYLRPEVFAPGLQLERHQNPYRHNLCLLESTTSNWNPSNTGAWLVSVRVPLLLALIEGDAATMAHEEAPQGEPASQYFTRQVGSVVFVPKEMLALPKDRRVGSLRLSVGHREHPAQVLRACLSRVAVVDDRSRTTTLATVEGPLAQRFGRTALRGSWVRLDRFPVGAGTGEELLAAARRADGYRTPPLESVRDGQLRVVGVVCEEEVRQGVWEDSWLFAIQLTTGSGKQLRRAVYIARGERLSVDDLSERIPTLRGLQGKTVALAGTGALGGPIAMELARSLVGEVRILDFDSVEAGTVVRWPFGLGAVGHQKTRVLRDQQAHDYPFTRVREFRHHVGDVGVPGGPPERSDAEVLTEFLDGADLLVDATAEIGVQQLLAALADEAGIPQLYVSATEGGWGGIVARVVPGHTGCWYCLQQHLDDGTITAPPLAGTGTVQPRGCTAPTWTGTSFDALPLVAQAMRTATSTMLAGRPNDAPVDVFVCHQAAARPADLCAPEWKWYRLDRYEQCPVCAV